MDFVSKIKWIQYVFKGLNVNASVFQNNIYIYIYLVKGPEFNLSDESYCLPEEEIIVIIFK